jgi:hypothetical protein
MGTVAGCLRRRSGDLGGAEYRDIAQSRQVVLAAHVQVGIGIALSGRMA